MDETTQDLATSNPPTVYATTSTSAPAASEPLGAPAPLPRVEVRATINLPTLKAGAVVSVDPSLPYISDLMKLGYLVPTRKAE